MTGHPGLNAAVLRALRATPHNQDQITTRIAHHLETHDGYLALSGGKDSVVVLDLARQVDPNLPVVFFDSGLEYPETYTYLDHLRHIWRLNLTVIDASTPLLTILITNGSWDHQAAEYRTPDIHQALIADPARQAHTMHGPGELWGVRAAESAGRRAAYATALLAHPCNCCTDRSARAARHGGIISRADGTTVYGPIWNWTDDQVWAHINRRKLPLNPVYDKLRAMGAPLRALRISHLLDADHLDRGRAVWLKRGWPDLYERLHQVLPRLSEHL